MNRTITSTHTYLKVIDLLNYGTSGEPYMSHFSESVRINKFERIKSHLGWMSTSRNRVCMVMMSILLQ